MIKTILNKIFLIAAGLVVALILLEISMWTAGFALSSYQTYKNGRALKNKAKHVVMCIGESTTDRQYPIPLQKILDSRYPGKFSIIDCGKSGTDLTSILESLDGNIQKYAPDIAVCMMGINDGLSDYLFDGNLPLKPEKTSGNAAFYKKIKVYRLFILIKKHIKSLSENKNIYADGVDVFPEEDHLVKQAEHLYRMGDYKTSLKILNEIIKKNPNDEDAYSCIIEIYFHHLPGFKNKGYKMALDKLNRGTKFDRAGLYLKVISYNLAINDIPLAKKFINELLNEPDTKIPMILYGCIKDFITPEQKKKILASQKTDLFYGATAIYYMEMKDYEKADKYFKIAEDMRLYFPNEQTNGLYRLIVKKLIDNHIKVICMQYPVRSIKPLQNILKDEPYYDKITFVSNEKIFKQALMEKPYDKVFADQFGGDFGHCVDGDSLVAENVAKTLAEVTK